jgi:hypothetical protein
LGPLADKSQLERVLGYIEAGKSEAELLVGGERKGEKGTFVQPTIFLNPKKDAKIYREEIFGPVLTILTFDTEEEAIKLANDTSYGLSGKCSWSSLILDCPPSYRENMQRLTRSSNRVCRKHRSCSTRGIQDQGGNCGYQYNLQADCQFAIWRIQAKWSWARDGQGRPDGLSTVEEH